MLLDKNGWIIMLVYSLSQVDLIPVGETSASLGLGPDVAELDGDQPHIGKRLGEGVGDLCQLPGRHHQLCLRCCQHRHCNHDGLLPEKDEACNLSSALCLWTNFHRLHAHHRGVHHLQRIRHLQSISLFFARDRHQPLLRLCSNCFRVCCRTLLPHS